MATLYANSDGSLVAFVQSLKQKLALSSELPSSSPNVLDFDEATNAATVADIMANWTHYALPSISGTITLQKDGVTVPINPASSDYTAHVAVLSGVPVSTVKSFIQTLWAGSATSAQQQKAIAYALLKILQLNDEL